MGGERAHVLVTGCAGYVGSILTERLLEAGHRVTGLDSLRYGNHSLFHLCARPSFDFVHADARDERILGALVSKADVVVPMAAITGGPACDRNPAQAMSVNRDAIALINRLRSAEQLVLFPNTNSAYGAPGRHEPCTEDSPLTPISLYAHSKIEAESLLLDRPNVVAFRLATAFGASPRMRLDLLVNHFTHAAATDGYIVVFEKDFRRNYVHVRDVADAFVHAIEHGVAMAGRPYNLGLDEANCSKGELALRIKEHVPGFFVHFAEIGQDPDKRDYVVSSARLSQAGFTARRSLDDGIRELLKAYRLLPGHECRNA